MQQNKIVHLLIFIPEFCSPKHKALSKLCNRFRSTEVDIKARFFKDLYLKIFKKISGCWSIIQTLRYQCWKTSDGWIFFSPFKEIWDLSFLTFYVYPQISRGKTHTSDGFVNKPFISFYFIFIFFFFLATIRRKIAVYWTFIVWLWSGSYWEKYFTM